MTAFMTAADAVKRAAKGEIIVIDLRNPPEIASTGSAAGALRIPLPTLPMAADSRSPDFRKDLAAGKPIALFCAAGARAGQAKDLLERMGYSDVHNIGGFGHWQQAGGPVEV